MNCLSRRCTLRGMLKSAVIWSNSVILAIVPLLIQFQDTLPMLREFFPEDIYRWAFVIVTIVNIALRFKTKESLKDKGTP